MLRSFAGPAAEAGLDEFPLEIYPSNATVSYNPSNGIEVRAMGLGRSLAVALVLGGAWCGAQETKTAGSPPQGRTEAPVVAQEPVPPVQAGPPPVSNYDKAMFLKPIAPDLLTGLKAFDGAPAKDLWRDKQFRKALKSVAPDCTFHYGSDMSLDAALDIVIKDSRVPVTVRDGRYLLVSGLGGPYLGGRGFVWIDLQDGIGLGGFYFHPTNGEPSPSLAVFSRQVKEDQLAMSELPPEFAKDLVRWSYESRVPTVATRYFLTGGNKRVLLEHDEDYCSPVDGSVAGPGDSCEQMNADAADVDETAAYYLKQVNYKTNATAWMIGPDQVAWIGVRDRTCGGVVDPLGCRIRVTREHTHLIIGRRGPVGRR